MIASSVLHTGHSGDGQVPVTACVGPSRSDTSPSSRTPASTALRLKDRLCSARSCVDAENECRGLYHDEGDDTCYLLHELLVDETELSGTRYYRKAILQAGAAVGAVLRLELPFTYGRCVLNRCVLNESPSRMGSENLNV